MLMKPRSVPKPFTRSVGDRSQEEREEGFDEVRRFRFLGSVRRFTYQPIATEIITEIIKRTIRKIIHLHTSPRAEWIKYLGVFANMDQVYDDVVDEVLTRRKETEWFIEGDFDAYVERIRKPYVWGGELELLMASHLLNIGSSERLMNIAQQLRLFNTNYNPIEDPTIKDSAGKAVPQDLTTNSESATNPPERIRSKRAAVLICLFEDERGDLRVILTKRSSTLSTNSGDVSLPGGKTDEGDANDVETALREAKEEIGLDPSLVIVVSVLQPLVTKDPSIEMVQPNLSRALSSLEVGITVVPVVGILPDKRAFNPTLNTAEVESIFDAPLAMFLKDQNRRAEEREWMGDKYLLHFFDHETENGVNYVIWALTAGILIRTASIVYQQPPDFQVSEPKFWTRSC